MTQALYRKWRPHQWDQVIGQEHVVKTLRNAITADRVAHAYLLAGPRGTGKTTTARLLGKAVNCLAPDLAARPCDECDHCVAVNQGRFLDLIEIDAASNTSVEDVRDLRDKINFSPNQGRYKVYVIDEVHMLSTAAFNALLKTLEEPPSHAIFILATTEVHKIPATVLSRCQRHEFRRIPVNDIVANLKTLAEGEDIAVDEDALLAIARQATGAMRDAISLLDQLASTGQRINLEMAQTVLGTAASQSVLDLLDALTARDPAAGLDVIHRTLDTGTDPRQFARQVVEYLRSLLLVRMGNAAQVDAPAETRAQMARHAQAFSVADLVRVLRAFNQAAVEGRAAWQPSLPLEIAFVEALEAPHPGAAEPAGAGEAASKGKTPKDGQSKAEHSARGRGATSAPVATPVEARVPPLPEEPVAESPANPPAADGVSSEAGLVQKLNEHWRGIVAIVKQRNANTAGLLNSVKTRDLRNNVLTLGFASDVLKSQMEKSNNVELVQDALKQVIGVGVAVRCVTVSSKRSTPPSDVDGEGMVASALRDLGGEIVDIQ